MAYKLKPALIGGGALGLFLVFTILLAALPVPFIRTLGCCNCLWPIAAGLLATMLYVKGSPTPATALDGAILGALAGALGGIIYLIIGLPITYFVNGLEAMDMQVRQINPDFPLSGLALLVIGGIVAFFVYVVLSTIGGLIGVPIFEKRKAAEPPPPPQDFGARPGGPSSTGL
ncbi:MAG: hypothetical protein ND895_05190 [Pyrinomonadaceae bacterium]|nr:hypothetical protein [Pyrinomonadaceae bacterium]